MQSSYEKTSIVKAGQAAPPFAPCAREVAEEPVAFMEVYCDEGAAVRRAPRYVPALERPAYLGVPLRCDATSEVLEEGREHWLRVWWWRRTQRPNKLVAHAAASVESEMGEVREPGEDGQPAARRRHALRGVLDWEESREGRASTHGEAEDHPVDVPCTARSVSQIWR